MLVDPVSVAPNVGTSPVTGFEKASRSVIAMFEVADPSATTGDEPVMVEVA